MAPSADDRIRALEQELAELKVQTGLDDELPVSRRGFIRSGVATLSLGSISGPSTQPAIEIPDGVEGATDAEGFIAAPRYIGPLSARPDPNGEFFADKTGVFVYKADGSGASDGEEYWISVEQGRTSSGWSELPVPTTVPTNLLDEVKTQNEISFFNHTFARPEAPDAKNWSFTDADIAKDGSEIELQAASTTLETRQRGNYPPGSEATAGVAFRVTDTPTAGSAFGGYFDTNNGVLVGEDATDSFVELRKGGTPKKVRRPDWNGHVPDGRVWENNRPVITRFPHLFYGGGDIVVNALLHEDAGSQLKELHRFTPSNVDDVFGDGPPLDQPNLPARFETSSLSGANLRANAAHYQFALSETENRVNGEHITDVDAGTTGWTPLIAWRKRTNWEMVNVRPLKVSISAESADAKLELQLNPTLSGGTWSRPAHTSSSETSVEVNTGVSLDSNGERRWPGYVVAGQGNQPGAVAGEDLTFNLPANQTIVLAAQGVGGTSTLSGTLSWQEFF